MTFDPTAKLALRRSPTVPFDGPFIGPIPSGYIAAVVDGRFVTWNAEGMSRMVGSDYDLVPLQILPARIVRMHWHVDDRDVTLVELRPGERIVDAAGQVTHE